MGRPRSLREAAPGLARLLAEVRPELKRHRGLLAGGAVALVAQLGFRLLEPWPLKWVLDRVAGADGPWLRDLPGNELLWISAAALTFTVALRAAAGYASTIAFARVGNTAVASLRSRVFDHLHRLPVAFHRRSRGGDLLLRVISDCGILREVTVTALLPLAINVLVLITMAAVMFWLDPWLAAAAFAPVPLFLVFARRRARSIGVVGRRQRRREAQLASTAAESMGAIHIVQALSLQERFGEVFGAASRKDVASGVEGKRLAAGLERSVDVVVALCTATVLVVGGRSALQGDLTPGDLIVFTSYLRRALRPLRDFAKYTARLAKASAAGERVLEILELEPAVRDLPGARPAPTLTGAVSFDRVTFRHPGAGHGLTDVQLEIPAGQHVVIVGTSGAGKSTLLGMLIRVQDPDAGAVSVDGIDVRELGLGSLRRQIGILHQEPLLFAASIRENIAWGAESVSDQEVKAAARLAGAHRFIERLPHGYETQLGERGGTLSRGELQRIAIARLAVRKAPILILDEPTTGLDENNRRLVGDALARLARGRTCVMVTHDLDAAERCDRVVVLEKGHVVADGLPSAILPGLRDSTVEEGGHALVG
ncbi:MAG: ABC transporter ATP-binding protein [Deltaproteobacteria bacterium]|nr:ABC transporter ATP-binding protein [Deltaproteobacteria bacterium]